MRLHYALLCALLVASALVDAQEHLGTYEDRIAVEDVMARYVWTVDALDADGNVAVFTEDAAIDSNGSISRGHAEIRQIGWSSATASGDPVAQADRLHRLRRRWRCE